MPIALLLLTTSSLKAEEPVRTPYPVRLVAFEHAQEQVSGYLLRGDPERARLLVVTADARLLDLPVEDVQSPRTVATHDVTRIPSRGLVTALSHEDPVVADEAMMLLSFQGATMAPALSVALEGSSSAKWRALDILTKSPQETLLPRVKACLADADVNVRRHALAAYAASDPHDLVRVCERFLVFDDDLCVRHEALCRLGRSDRREAVPIVMDQLPDLQERGMKLAAFAALRRLTGLRLGRDLAAWQGWWANHGEDWLREIEL